jgi:hypothetical protein
MSSTPQGSAAAVKVRGCWRGLQQSLEFSGAKPLRLAGAAVFVELEPIADEHLGRVTSIGLVAPLKVEADRASPLSTR